MAKVIVERERTSSRVDQGTRRRNWKRHDAPNNVKMQSGIGWEGKQFTDVLNPLYGFFNKNVGRPWDKVYSEMCERLKPTSTTQKHVLDHVKHDIVNISPSFDENWFPWSFRYSDGRALAPGELYVDRNGFLARVKKDWRYEAAKKLERQRYQQRWGHAPYQKQETHERKREIDGVKYVTKDGVWFRQELVRIEVRQKRKDGVVQFEPGGHVLEERVEIYRDRQLSKKELKRLNLWNRSNLDA